MKISYKWLKELLPALKASPHKLAQKLTHAGLEVEAIEECGARYKNVVVAQVLEKNKHPNADRLSLCRVTDGREEVQIVCGALNVRAGKKYPLAKLGAILPNGMEIAQTKIRGVESFGMLCSTKELGLSQEAEGIFELEDKAKLGQNFSSYYGLDDIILEIGMTPNRGDCLSQCGVAREVAALYHLKQPQLKTKPSTGTFKLGNTLSIQLRDKNGCFRYCSRMIRGVKIGSSPLWMQKRLERCGVRSINNVVDATNYVMLETGHPLHAFDNRFIRGNKIIVRKAGTDKIFKTLDHIERELKENDLVIADEEGPLALAGIMGGENSEVLDDTSTVVLEAASFNPLRIRQTRRRLGLFTESSQRFERYVPRTSVRQAMDRLVELILENAGGEVSKETLDCYPSKEKQKFISLRESTLMRICGMRISTREVTNIFKSLGFNPKKTKTAWRLEIPFYRSDLEREIDLVEEVVRIYGIDNIQSSLPSMRLKSIKESLESLYEDKVRTFFSLRGFNEVIHYSFCDSKDIEKTGGSFNEVIKLKNPINQEMTCMRPSLLPGLIHTYLKNQEEKELGLCFFELRSIYKVPKVEEKRLAGIYGGNLFSKNWQKLDRKMDFFDGKGLLEDLFQQAHLAPVIYSQDNHAPYHHPYQSMSIKLNGKVLGNFGCLHPQILNEYKISEPLFYFDLDYSFLVQHWGSQSKNVQAPSLYPKIIRDLALVADKNLEYSQIIQIIKETQVEWLEEVSLYDVYLGENIPQNKKSMTFSLVYQNTERTLTDDEVNKAHFALVDVLKSKLSVELR